ncbi:MAG TPA: translation elongation factor Ts [Firmicutes bacterium]|jgi:elongation factor Ts|nr:translation elongation factor Ts [Bacillota bacterium]
MAEISAGMVKELREMTGAGMMDCKKALVACEGDMDKAVVYLREKGLAKAAKRSEREASEGVVDSYIHGGGRIGVLIEVNCETDFVARNEQFRTLVHELAMQVAAANPSYVRREEVPADVIAKEEQILLAQAVNEGKPEHIAAKIVAGRMEKFFQESCLMEQPFFRDQDKTVQDVVNDYIALIGENIMVRRFCRFAIGE